MRIFYLFIALFILGNVAFAQHHHTPQGDISFPQPYPKVYPTPGNEPMVISRSGNNYKVPFDTVKFNSTIGTKGFDIVICIDGAINNGQIALADNYVDSIVNRLKTIPHYLQRFQYFNIYRIGKLSNQQGAGFGFTNPGLVDNRYGTRFNAYNLPRLVLPTKLDTLYQDIEEFVPGADLIIVIAYDKKYGGSGMNAYDGHKIITIGMDEEYGKDSYHLSDEVVMHEMQHTMPLAGRSYLADEYEDSAACSIYDTLPLSYKNSPNYTGDTINNRKWQYWIDAGTPGVGFYDSAGICRGNYRPSKTCIMRQIFDIPEPGKNRGMPSFCPVCRENSTAYFDSIINPVYDTSAAPSSYRGFYTFFARIDTAPVNTYRYQWILDDSIIATGISSVLINFDNLDTTTNHLLQFVCTDIDGVIKDTTLRRPWITRWKLLTYNPATAIAELPDSRSLSLFPNPASNHLLLSVIDFQPERIFIYDINSRKISDLKFNQQVDISALIPGMYFIEVRVGNISVRKSFMKE